MAAKMSGPKLVGRVVATQALLIVLMETAIDRPDVNDARKQELVASYSAWAKRLGAQFGHPEAEKEAIAAADEMIKILIANIPAMKGDGILPPHLQI